jgi:hypothetical protein
MLLVASFVPTGSDRVQANVTRVTNGVAPSRRLHGARMTL